MSWSGGAATPFAGEIAQSSADFLLALRIQVGRRFVEENQILFRAIEGFDLLVIALQRNLASPSGNDQWHTYRQLHPFRR
jgi:hypothetical protein